MSTAIGISEGHGCQVYNLSQSKTLPEFMEEAIKQNKSLKKNKEFKERLEVIQGFEFSTCSSKVAVSRDGRHVGAIGMYPPDFKVYDTADLSMKFQRRLDSEVVDFMFLTDDYKKVVLLQADRFLEFHDQGGRHHRERIPTFGRNLEFNYQEAELLVSSASPNVYRLDLYEGRFLPALETNMDNALVCKHNGTNTFVGGDSRICEVFDTRASNAATANIAVDEDDVTITAIAVHENNRLALGTSDGVVNIYDLRNTNVPVCVKNHQVDSEIRDIQFIRMRNEIDEELAVASADPWSVKIWRPTSDGIENMATFEAQGKVNSICCYPRSGMVFVAQDFPRVGVHFLPAVGLAPPWSPFVDQIVEDMRESKNMVLFENYEFITKADLAKLGMAPQDLDGQIKAYQHGFMILKTLYRKLLRERKMMSENELRDYLVNKELAEAERKNPFSLKYVFKRDSEPVDEGFVHSLVDLSSAPAANKKTRHAASSILEDDRFRDLLK